MLRYGWEIYQTLIKMFARTNKRFPNEKEIKWIQNQALRIRESLFNRGVNMENLSAEDAIKIFSKPPKTRKPPTAEIYKPLEFGKKTKPKEGLAALDKPKVFDQFRDENTLTNLYRTQEQALADGDIDTSRKIQKQIDAIINKEPLNDFADGGRVGFNLGGFARLKKLLELAKKAKSKLGKAPKTNLKKVRSKVEADKKNIQELADNNQIPVKDQTVKSKYKFTGRETEEDLYKLEEQGIITRSDHNVYDPRYLEWLDARVKYYYGYTKGQMNKIQNQPARLNYLRAQVSPRWGEAHFGEDYTRILEKARGEEIKAVNPGKDKSGPFDHIFEKMYKPVRDEMDKIPGEDPLLKKRTLHADGGLATLFEEK